MAAGRASHEIKPFNQPPFFRVRGKLAKAKVKINSKISAVAESKTT